MPPLVPCPNCQRHVRSTEQTCPFCKAKSRSAAGFLGAALGAVLATGCPSGPQPQRPAAEYGAPPPPPTVAPSQPSASPSASPADLQPLTPDDMRPAAEYGAPPPLKPDPDDFRGAAEYGAPPPRARPAEPDDRERAVPKYGAPPPRVPKRLREE